jgi:diaminopimelate epimerase
MEFRKYEALGNDYVVLDARKWPALPAAPAIRKLCDRRYGIGADGILFGPLVDPAGFRLRIFNPDGSEAEKSGNGIRIFARYLRDAGDVTGNRGTIVTAGGVVAFKYLDAQAHRIEVEMGRVTFWSQQIPVTGPNREVINETLQVGDRALRVTCLSIGNPHCVVFDGATQVDAKRLGPQIEVHPSFPNRTNVQFVEVVSRERLRIQIWERGAGYTLASGSSSCAAASAAHRLGLVGNRVEVEMPGGVIEIHIADDGQVSMTGDVRATIQGFVSDDLAQSVSGAR